MEQLRAAAGNVFARGFGRKGERPHRLPSRIAEEGWYRGIVGGIPKAKRSGERDAKKGSERERERYGATTLLRMHPVQQKGLVRSYVRSFARSLARSLIR